MNTEIKHTIFRNISYHAWLKEWKYRADSAGNFEVPDGRLIIMPEGVTRIAIVDEQGNTVAVVFPRVIQTFPHYSWNGPDAVPDIPVFMEPSMPHDVLCQLIKEGRIPAINQKLADYIFMREVRNNGGSWTLSRVAWVYIRGFQYLRKGV